MENPQILRNTPQDSRTDYRPVQRNRMLCSNRRRCYKILQNHDWCQARMCIITTFIYNSYGLRTQTVYGLWSKRQQENNSQILTLQMI